MQRYFAKEKENEKIYLYESDIYHIKKVMRNQIGDEIEVVFGEKVYICKIIKLDLLELEIINEHEEDKELNINLTVAVSLVSEQKFDLIIQKLTELGVSTIIPFKSERSIVKLDEHKIGKKLLRWQTICKEASEQSKRVTVPKITNIMTLKELSQNTANLKLICSLKSNPQFLDKYLNKNTNSILFAIGPEGGFTSAEESYLIDNGFKSVSLGARVLRVETAAIYITSVINYIYRG